MDKDIGRQAKQEDRKAKKAEEKEKKKTGYILLGENRGNKIQEQRKKELVHTKLKVTKRRCQRPRKAII